MRERRALILELLVEGPGTGWYTRKVKIPNFSGVMSQAIAVWCEELGWMAELRTYTGEESPKELLAGDWDIVFVSAFTRASSTAYAIAATMRERGVPTVLGGPHARAWPTDAARYFDYVLGLTDREVVQQVLEERLRAKGDGVVLSAAEQPRALPRLRQRARFLGNALRKAHLVHVVPILGSVGCPYACDFCSDAEVPYRPLPFDDLADDLRFAAANYPGATVFWMDPSFGVRFDAYLDLIERTVRPGILRFGAETTLSLLSPKNVERLAQAGFEALLPGIESWSSYHQKSGLRRLAGREKVAALSAKITAILERVAYVQANLVFGLDGEDVSEAFEHTAEFVARCPGAWPNLNLMTVFGDAAPLGRRMSASGRLLPVPFPLLDQKTCLNVRTDFSLPMFYRGLADLSERIFGLEATRRRVAASPRWLTRIIHVFRAFGAEERRRIRWYRQVAGWLESDRAFRSFFEGDTTLVPQQLRQLAAARLGPFYDLLPDGALVSSDPCSPDLDSRNNAAVTGEG
jgi:hypothetical protein